MHGGSSFLWRTTPTPVWAISVLGFLDHTHRHTQQTQEQTTMSSAGYDPAIPAIKRPQTYALDRTASGIGNSRTIERRYTPSCRLEFEGGPKEGLKI